MTELHLTLDPPVSDATGAAATVRRLADAKGRSTRRDIRSVSIPSDGVTVSVDPGVYEIEVCLSSGEVVSDQIVVAHDDAMVDVTLQNAATPQVRREPASNWMTDEAVIVAFAESFQHPSAGGMSKGAVAAEDDMPDQAHVELLVLCHAGSRDDWDDVLHANSPRWVHLDETQHAIVRTADDHFKVSRPKRLRQRCWSQVSLADESRFVSLPFEPIEKSPARTVEIVVEAQRGAFRLLDDQVGGLLDYLSSESYGAAAIVLDAIAARINASTPARGHFHKHAYRQLSGVIGLCAAAYAATASQRLETWQDAIDDLATRDWLPDGAVLAGHRLLFEVNTEESWAEAGAWFRKSLDRGVPYFSLGLDYLMDGLTVLAGHDDSYRADLDQVTSVARRAKRGEAFTTLSQARA